MMGWKFYGLSVVVKIWNLYLQIRMMGKVMNLINYVTPTGFYTVGVANLTDAQIRFNDYVVII